MSNLKFDFSRHDIHIVTYNHIELFINTPSYSEP